MMLMRTYIINKTKVLFPQEKVILAFLFHTFGFIAPKACAPNEVYSRDASSVLILISTFLLFIRPCINLFIIYFARADNMLLSFTRGKI